MMDVSQIIMLHILNLYSAVYLLYLNKTGRKKDKHTHTKERGAQLPGTSHSLSGLSTPWKAFDLTTLDKH